MAHGLGHLLGQISLGKSAQSHHNFGIGFAQNCADLIGFQQRIDRIDDPCHCPPQQGNSGFQTVWQHKGHHIGRPDTQRPEQVRGLGHAGVQIIPCQGFGFVRRTRQQLKTDRRPGAMADARAAEEIIDRMANVAGLPRHFGFNGLNAGARYKVFHVFPPKDGLKPPLCRGMVVAHQDEGESGVCQGKAAGETLRRCLAVKPAHR